MPKGMVETTGGATAGTHLREMIRQLEIDAANLEGKREKVLDVLKLRDEIEEEIQRLIEQGLNLKSEQTRVETVDLILTRNAGLLERELKAKGGLAGVRATENPPEERKWWFVDVPYYAKKRVSRRNGLIAAGVIVVVLVIAFFVSNAIFGSGKRDRARAAFINGQQFMIRGDLTQATSELERAVSLGYGGEAQTYLSVAYELQSRDADAKNMATQAQATLKSRAKYMLTLAAAYQDSGRQDLALAKLDELIAALPKTEKAYLMRAEIYFAQNKPEEAAADYTMASELGKTNRNEEVFNQAELRLDIVMKTLTPEAGS